ncbi:hypothetical protein AFK24_09575 [Pseudomonas syringae]|uniref:Uncharacterized protein n=1 Tax=Pseudomonas syringae TaxID=317 RepID=A0A1C7Z7H0_PSESX|nr:hypothetical protein AFK24_09575 [Pseudomonas syringae]
MLLAFWKEALGLQVIKCPAARALDLQFHITARGGKFAAAMTTTYFLHVYKPSDSGRLPAARA